MMKTTSLLILASLVCRLAFDGVVRVEITERSDVGLSPQVAAAIPYERIVGKVHFAIDPNHAANRLITDIDFAPRNHQGLVEFSADLYLL